MISMIIVKVLILYAKVGNGHLKASEAIRDEIKSKYPDCTVFFEDGLEYSGASLIFDPLGNSLNEKINKEELIIKDINLSSIKEVREKINIKRDRREKLYKESEVKLYENRLE